MLKANPTNVAVRFFVGDRGYSTKPCTSGVVVTNTSRAPLTTGLLPRITPAFAQARSGRYASSRVASHRACGLTPAGARSDTREPAHRPSLSVATSAR